MITVKDSNNLYKRVYVFASCGPKVADVTEIAKLFFPKGVVYDWQEDAYCFKLEGVDAMRKKFDEFCKGQDSFFSLRSDRVCYEMIISPCSFPSPFRKAR